MKVTLDNYTEEPEMAIAQAGGISHDNEIDNLEDARELIGKFIEWGHGTPLEFADATFKIEKISRVTLAQLTRHRLANFMVRSFRYNGVEEGPVRPDSWDKVEDGGDLDRTVDQMIDGAHYVYDRLQDEGVPLEDARYVLPMGTKTDLYMKANFREWRHIFDERALNNHAQWEIRELTVKMLDKLYTFASSVFEDQYNELLDEGELDEYIG